MKNVVLLLVSYHTNYDSPSIVLFSLYFPVKSSQNSADSYRDQILQVVQEKKLQLMRHLRIDTTLVRILGCFMIFNEAVHWGRNNVSDVYSKV